MTKEEWDQWGSDIATLVFKHHGALMEELMEKLGSSDSVADVAQADAILQLAIRETFSSLTSLILHTSAATFSKPEPIMAQIRQATAQGYRVFKLDISAEAQKIHLLN